MIALDIFGMLLVLAGVAGVIAIVKGGRHHRDDTPGGHDLYLLTRKMAHALDGILVYDANLPMLSAEQRSNIQDLLREWEKQL